MCTGRHRLVGLRTRDLAVSFLLLLLLGTVAPGEGLGSSPQGHEWLSLTSSAHPAPVSKQAIFSELDSTVLRIDIDGVSIECSSSKSLHSDVPNLRLHISLSHLGSTTI